LLWCKIAAVRYFVWHLGLRMWSGSGIVRQAVRQLDKILSFTIFKKFNIQPSEDVLF